MNEVEKDAIGLSKGGKGHWKVDKRWACPMPGTKEGKECDPRYDCNHALFARSKQLFKHWKYEHFDWGVTTRGRSDVRVSNTYEGRVFIIKYENFHFKSATLEGQDKHAKESKGACGWYNVHPTQ